MNHTFIIAEAGVNHNGDIALAKELIKEAAKAGVDAIKFQTFKTENLVTKEAPKAVYQIEGDPETESQFDMLKRLELSEKEHKELIQYCRECNIQFLSAAFDLESVDLLKELKVPIVKIPSGEITNYPYLKRIGALSKPIILSTGMATIVEIEEAIRVLEDNGTKEIILLHCNTAYPTAFEDVNLKAMLTLQEKTGYYVGYSDHTLGIEVPIAAVALGAKVIEKHFTLDKTLPGPDHKASLNPEELKQMVKAIRNIEKSMGDGKKEPSQSEKNNMLIVRKSIVALKDIAEGEIFTEENLTVKRPGNGITPFKWDKVIGTIAKRNYKKDELIEE